MNNRSMCIAYCTLASLALGVAGCSEPYMHRQDRIAASAGDALEANKVLHIVDPWPRDSFRNSSASGRRAEPSIDRYNHSAPGGAAARATASSPASASVAQ